jgi:hypothetical protein
LIENKLPREDLLLRKQQKSMKSKVSPHRNIKKEGKRQ